ncbi:hypothetical protein ACHWQZ_G017053 [Mnemiopsis leidyi]
MAEDIKCLTESRMRAMEIIKQKMVEMKNQNEKLTSENADLSDRVQTLSKSYEELIIENENLAKELKELTKTSQNTEDELTARINILKEDLHEADKRADNSERQVVYLLKRVQQQEDLVAAYMEDYKGTGQFIDDSMNELIDI